MIDCKEAQNRITTYIEDKLTPQETMQFISHVRKCPSCLDELEIYYTIYNTFRVSGVDGTYDMGRRIKEDMESREKMIRLKRRGRVYVTTGIAMALIFGSLLAFIALFPGPALSVFLHIRSIFLKLSGQ